MTTITVLPQDVLKSIPSDLPAPLDDRACNHLKGLSLPSIFMPSTSGDLINLAHHRQGKQVIFCYPMTGRPGRLIPQGWAQIPGAAGCTPQACSIRDAYQMLLDCNVEVYGISTQSTEDQLEAVQRLHLPYLLLSDQTLQFAKALQLPLLNVAGMDLLKRITLIVEDGIIQKYFYPVFPPDQHIYAVLAWLNAHPQIIDE